MQKYMACPSRPKQGVGPAQAVPDHYSIGSSDYQLTWNSYEPVRHTQKRN
jgi:hypothetical protein